MTVPTPERRVSDVTLGASGVKKSLAGLWGEVIAGELLRGHGFEVTWIGGQGAHRDHIAVRDRPRASLDVQVKTTTRPDGYISWGRKGTIKVRPWIEQAERLGRVPTFLLVQLDPDPIEAILDQDKHGLWMSRPSLMAVSAMNAAEWGLLVDQARTAYAAEPYLRGPRKGEPKPESGLLYPVTVSEGYDLDTYLLSV